MLDDLARDEASRSLDQYSDAPDKKQTLRKKKKVSRLERESAHDANRQLTDIATPKEEATTLSTQQDHNTSVFSVNKCEPETEHVRIRIICKSQFRQSRQNVIFNCLVKSRLVLW